MKDRRTLDRNKRQAGRMDRQTELVSHYLWDWAEIQEELRIAEHCIGVLTGVTNSRQ